MNIAFAALLILVIALPGLCFVTAYRLERGRPANTGAITDELPLAVIVASLFHSAWIPLFTCLGQLCNPQVEPSLSAALTLLSAQSGKDGDLFREARSALTDDWNAIYVAAYFFTLSFAAFSVGFAFKKLAQYSGLDRWMSLLSWNSWFYLLRGKAKRDRRPDPDMIEISALVGNYLYRGILIDFFIAKDGTLDSLVLAASARRQVGVQENPQADDRNDAHPAYYFINAEHLVLKYSQITNLAVSRLYFEETQQGEPLGEDVANIVMQPLDEAAASAQSAIAPPVS